MVDHSARKQRMQHMMHKKEIDGCLITHNVDLFYFTGSMQTGYLFLPAEGDAVYYVRRSVMRAQEESTVSVRALESFSSLGDRLSRDFPRIFAGGKKARIAAAYDTLPVQLFQRLGAVMPEVSWSDGSSIIRETRMIKSAAEIAVIKQAAEAVDRAFELAVAQVRIGMSELELISAIEHNLRLNGHLGIMRMRGYNQEIITGMVGSGAAAAMPTYFDGPAGGRGLSAASPQSASRKQIERDEPILVDIGCSIDGYVIDQTRTLVIGALPEDMERAYKLSEEILRNTEANLQPGAVCEELYLNAVTMAQEAGLSEHFMGYGEDQVKFLGHGIGLEIDELPVLAKGFTNPLETGMVIAVEPKFTFPARGVVGVENTYAITSKGYEKLTRSREGLITLQV
jgi:Xaa-Pro dipeptidase